MTDAIQSQTGTSPSDWSIQRVDSLFDIQQGKSVSKAHRKGDNQKPFLRTRNIFWGRVDVSELDQMHFSEAEEARLKLQAGDLLLCEGGDVGRTAIWENQQDGCYYQNHLHRLRAKQIDGIDPKFALYWFWYAFGVGNIYFGRSNVTTIPNLSQSKLGELQVPVPVIAEQRRIANILTTVQAAIEQQKWLTALTHELRSTAMRKLFTEGLRGEKQKETELGFVPKSWELTQLGDCITRAQYGLSVRGSQAGKYPILRMTNQRDGAIVGTNLQYVDLSDEDMRKFKLKCGELLFNRTNSIDLVGRTALFELDGDYVFASYLIRLTIQDGKLEPHFLNYYLNYEATQARLKALASRGVSQSNISASRLKTFTVPIPPLDEQREIAATLQAVDAKLAMTERKRATLEELFRTLLHLLMTGQIRVNNLDLPGLN
jgi:type I restriction enzyme, S subunit